MIDVLGDRIEMVAWQFRYAIPYAAHVTHVCMPRLKGIDVPEVEMGNESEFSICCNRQPSTNQHVAKVA